MSLRNMFEQQIEERTKELKRQKEEEARVSVWLVSNALQQDATLSTRSRHDKVCYSAPLQQTVDGIAFFRYL